MLKIKVCYAKPDIQRIFDVEVEEGATLADAIARSGILTVYPEINLATVKVGVFSKIRKLDEKVTAGDRIEIYRPLLIDPKEARRAKARKSRT